MTRKLPLGLLLFAHLTILPGCQNLPFFGGTVSEAPRKSFESVQNQPTDVPDSSEPANVPALREFPIARPLPTPLLETGLTRPEKRPDGLTGIVTLEPGLAPGGQSAVSLQPAPLPQVIVKKRDYAPAVLAFQCMLDDRHEEALKHLRTYDESTQEFLLRVLPALTNLVKKRLEDMSPPEVAALNQQIRGLLVNLIPRSELVVSKMCFCKWVKTYGHYQPLPENHAFLAGTESRFGEQVQLYVELMNFESKPTKEGDFLTKLSCSLELHDGAGKKVWSKSFDGNETTHRRRTAISDFYSNYSFYVPAIPAGTYQLTVHIADETNPKQRRVASETLVFRVTPVANQPPLR